MRSATCSLACLFLIGAVSHAQPEHGITDLSVENAKRLAQDRSGRLLLNSVTSLTPEAAKELARHEGWLSLNGLMPLSNEAAEALGQHKGQLHLDGLTKISDAAPKALARHNGELSLKGLTLLSDEAAIALAKYTGGRLYLNGVRTLSTDAAKALAQRKGGGPSHKVCLDGLESLTVEGAAALAQSHGHNWDGRLPAMKSIPADVAKALAKRASISMEGLTTLSDESAKALGGKLGGNLPRLTSLTVESAKAIVGPNRTLVLDGLTVLPDDVAMVIGGKNSSSDLHLNGLTTFTPVAAKEISQRWGDILLGGPRGSSVPPPRLWRLSPSAYTKSLSGLNINGLQQPFGLIQESGFRDFSALYVPDEGATSLLLTNTEQVVLAQVRGHTIVNLVAKPEFGKETLWPSEGRIKTATAEERKHLEKGDRVRQGNGSFAPLMHPKVAANRDELVKALNQQYQAILSRTPNEKELESLLELYKDVAKEGDYTSAGKTVLMAPLMTPEAILRFEIGLGAEVRPGVRMLSPRETAFAISLALSTNRDLGLLSTAAQGKLTTREEVAAAVRKILEDPKLSKSRVPWFFREYFDYYRATEVFKDPVPDHLQRRGVYFNARQYVEDTDVLVLSILSHDKDVFKELLTTTDSYRTHELFGSAEDGLRNGHGPLFRKFSPYALEHRRPQRESIGIPMQQSWLVAWSVGTDNDIVRRGRWVREKLLGGRVPDLPINVQAMVLEDPHRTLRQRQMVTRAGDRWKWHYRMDDLGTPFENVNHYGFVRTTEPVIDLEAMKSVKDKKTKIYREAPLDTTGFILHIGDPRLDGPVKDAPEMLRRLADSDRVRQVFIRHVFRFFLGRNETPGDAPTLQEADRAYVESDGSFKALLVSLLSSESFLYRTMPTKGSHP